MSDQADLAARLIDAMEDDLLGDATVLDVLDDLAVAGLRLVPDEEGIAARAYFGLLIDEGQAPDPGPGRDGRVTIGSALAIVQAIYRTAESFVVDLDEFRRAVNGSLDRLVEETPE